ncbi:MAG TPA: MBL fold metallo-hydrolase, partial [Longimicrobiaceae bacterium]|nr:MBL fold metallo-hydrolase [Longimicrobiaceae bacterium]
GNTSCLEVRTPDGRSLIFDAGTGIRRLGNHLASTGQPLELHLFLTHFHWDHIQGLPFFAPIYDPRSVLHFHGPPQEEANLESLLAGQMGSAYFPVRLDQLGATLDFHDMEVGTWRQGDLEVEALRVCHPSRTYGYRIRVPGATLAYVPDNEISGVHYPVSDCWYEEMVAALRGVDCLLHDAMFTSAEHPTRIGWGHSTFEQAIQLAEDAGVRRLLFFHHAPGRTDAELLQILEEMHADLARRRSPLEIGMATEEEEFRLGDAGGDMEEESR